MSTATDQPRLLYLSDAEIQDLDISVPTLVETVEQVLALHGHEDVEMPPKSGFSLRSGESFRAMTAHLPGLSCAGLKWISYFPSTQQEGLPRVTGLIILNNVKTGLPQAILDARWITAMRTAAVSAVACKHLGPPGAETMAIIGAGVQARSHCIVFGALFPNLRNVKLFSRRPWQAEDLACEMNRFGWIRAEVSVSARLAIQESDIVVSATSIVVPPQPFLQANWIRGGTLVLPLELMSAWEWQLLRTVDRFFVDDWRQFKHYGELGYFPEAALPSCAQMGEIVAGLKPGRLSSHENIAVINTGMAILDVAVANLVRQEAAKAGLGTLLE